MDVGAGCLPAETHVCRMLQRSSSASPTSLDHKKNCTKTPPVLILKDSEGPMSSEDDWDCSASQPPSPGREEGHRDDGSVRASGRQGTQGQCWEERNS